MKLTSVRRACLGALLLISIATLPAVGATTCTKSLADGVTFTQNITTGPDAACIVNVVKIDLKKPGIKVAATLAHDSVIENDATKGRETVSSMVSRKNALVGINSDFFPYTGDPLGFSIMGGELVSEPFNRAAMGITSAGDVVFDRVGVSGTLVSASGASYKLAGVNRPCGQNEIVLETTIFGLSTGLTDGVEVFVNQNGQVKINTDLSAVVSSDPITAANSTIPAGGAVLCARGKAADWIKQNVRSDDKLQMRFNVISSFGKTWDNVVEAVGGGSMLVRDGQVFVDAKDEGFDDNFSLHRHPRSAVGVNSKGELMIVSVDGRQDISRGMTLAELAALMKSLGAVQAINLDGGGSTALSVGGLIVNSPSEGTERPVANALLVYATQTPCQSDELAFTDNNPVFISAGDTKMFQLKGNPPGNLVWGSTGGIGFINQKGYFVAGNTRKGKICVLSGGKKIELPVEVVAAEVATLTAKIADDDSGAVNRGKIIVNLADKFGNGIPGKSVTIKVAGGNSDFPTAVTNSKGEALFTVTWDKTAAEATVSVSSSGKTATAK